jgi:predicted transcriptional regulator of viral defense system
MWLRKIPVELARKKIFSTDDAAKAFNVSRDSLNVILSRMEKEGVIERLERGKYLVIPLASRSGEYTLHEFVIGSELIEPYAVSYWSALNHHGLTEQIPYTVFIQTTSRKSKRDFMVMGVRYLVIRVKESKFYGLEKTWIEDKQVNITDKEKTIIDCLDKPEHCGGVIEVAKALKYHDFDHENLSTYAVRIGNSGVIRRLGYLCDYLDIDILLPEIDTRSYLYLDPTQPKNGDTDSKWRLRANIKLDDLE